MRNNLTATEVAAMTAKSLDMSLYLPTGNEERILKAYENRDPRLKANVITPYSDYNGVTPVISRWPYRVTNGLPVADLRTDTGNLFYYLHRKFVYEGNTGVEIINRAYGPTDFPLIRSGYFGTSRSTFLNFVTDIYTAQQVFIVLYFHPLICPLQPFPAFLKPYRGSNLYC